MAQVLAANPHTSNSPFDTGSLDRSTPSSRPPRLYMPPASYARGPASADWSQTSSAPSSPYHDLSRSSSFHSTPPSSTSLSAHYPDEDDDTFMLPSYDQQGDAAASKSAADADESTDSSETSTSDGTDADNPFPVPRVADDTEIKEEPTQQVDYLSHDWREDDIHSSWKYIVSNRRHYGERSRLENASWRTWAKSKYNLKTVSPEKLNWLKDCDVTWLYGPLSQSQHVSHLGESSGHHLRKSNSFITGANKKSNLKKRSVSEVMLQKSISTSSLVKQAAAAVQAQRRHSYRPSYGDVVFASTLPSASTTTADYTDTVASSSASGAVSPNGSRKHIRFDTNVEQCMAVDFEPVKQEPHPSPKEWEQALDSPDSSSDDDLPMMKAKFRPTHTLSRTNSSRNSICSESRGITKLPSTKIRFHADEAEAQEKARQNPILSWARSTPPSHGLDKSPSQETLRPSRPGSHHLAEDEADDDDDDIMDWQATVPYSRGQRSAASSSHTLGPVETAEETRMEGLRRTPSGMFMPFENPEDDEALVGNGILGKMVDTVNTARDIAHLVWNVGWRK